MDSKTIKTMLKIGETIAVEFKRCGNGIETMYTRQFALS